MGSPRFCKKGAASWLEVLVLLPRGFWFWECRLSQPCLLAETVLEQGNTKYRASAHYRHLCDSLHLPLPLSAAKMWERGVILEDSAAPANWVAKL